MSKFHDYYDCIMRQGIDKTIVYLRREEEDATLHCNTTSSGWTGMSRSASWSLFVVGFCGKVYVGMRTCEPIERSYESTVRFLYGKDEILTWLAANDFKIRNADHYLDQKPFKDWKHPIFVYGGHTVNKPTWNACLKDYEFQRVMDPYTAFQELQMWVGSQARPERPIIETSDETRLEAHGFDKKYSFRKGKRV